MKKKNNFKKMRLIDGGLMAVIAVTPITELQRKVHLSFAV